MHKSGRYVIPSSGGAGVTFKDIPGFPGYRISDTGVVQSKRHRNGKPSCEWRVLKLWINNEGYYNVDLRSAVRNRNKVKVHRLVLLAFCGPPPSDAKYYACHRNGIRTDNRLENLYWGTPAQNCHDRKLHGNEPDNSGSRNGSAKLTEQDVRAIRQLVARGAKPTALAKQFGVSRCATWAAARGKTWKNVS